MNVKLQEQDGVVAPRRATIFRHPCRSRCARTTRERPKSANWSVPFGEAAVVGRSGSSDKLRRAVRSAAPCSETGESLGKGGQKAIKILFRC